MTLTRYIALYLYNPILLSVQRRRLEKGKKTSRKSLATFGGFSAMVAYPTMFTMLLTGIWHGAGLQFIVFAASSMVCISSPTRLGATFGSAPTMHHLCPSPPVSPGLP